jgi:aminoglycoside phosphotransferase (APT) family kinase protein
MPGIPLLDVSRAERAVFADELLAFADAVHALEVDAPVDDTPPAAWWFPPLPAPPSPAERLVFIHGDLGAEHVFVHDGRITGVIDWSDAALGDPALDHGRLARDLGLDLGERARFYAVCTALEDVAYGVEPYVSNALAYLGW